MKYDPLFTDAHYGLGRAYMREGRQADAGRIVTSAEAAGFRVNPRLKQEMAAMTR